MKKSEELLNKMKKRKLRHKILRKIGLCPYVDYYNMVQMINFTFENMKDFMVNQGEFNEEVFEFMSDMGFNDDNKDRGMIQ
jgi:hypothetical protein